MKPRVSNTPELDPATIAKIFLPKQQTNKVNADDLSSQADRNLTEIPAILWENIEIENENNNHSYTSLETPDRNWNCWNKKANYSTINCKMERERIYKQMRKSLLIQNNLQNIGLDMGQKSSELRDGLKTSISDRASSSHRLCWAAHQEQKIQCQWYQQ